MIKKYLNQIIDASIVTLGYSFLLNTPVTKEAIMINVATAVMVAIIVEKMDDKIQKLDEKIGLKISKDIITLLLLLPSRIYLAKGNITRKDYIDIALAIAGATIYNVLVDKMIKADIKPVYSTLIKVLFIFGFQNFDEPKPFSLDKLRLLSYRLNAVTASIFAQSLIN